MLQGIFSQSILNFRVAMPNHKQDEGSAQQLGRIMGLKNLPFRAYATTPMDFFNPYKL